MSVLQGASQVIITGGTQIAANRVTINQSSTFKDLSATAAHTALHDSSARFDAPRCHRNTRTTYLGALERWMLGLEGEYDSKRLIWLTGGAGAGKSAIMQSIVERCSQYSVILGTFFFSRADPSRNHAEVLIPTLTYQLARAFPAALTTIEPTIRYNPLIFKASLRTQAYELIVRPLLYLIETGIIDTTCPLRKVFVIDGLDECDDPQKQAHIIHIVAGILCDYDVLVSFLIASRPELAISRALQTENRVHSILSSITLDNNDEASSDIRQFIEDSFLDILDTHPLRHRIPINWPDHNSVEELVWKSSGHFIYAATAMKFISSSHEHPTRALQVVKGLVPSRMGNPFAELDALYLHIVTSAKYSSEVLGILRHCVLADLVNSVGAVCFMYPHFSPEDVELFLSDVRALVSLHPNYAAGMQISLKHASLSDFFRDANRSHAIYISQGDYKASLLPRYFLLFDNSFQVLLPSLFAGIGILRLILGLHDAISHSQDIELLQTLIYQHSPQYVWNFCIGPLSVHMLSMGSPHHGLTVLLVSLYLRAIRDSAANHDNSLYIYYFEMFIQVIMDNVMNAVQTKTHSRIIPALIFSSSPSCLTSLAPHLIQCFPRYSQSPFSFLFTSLRPMTANIKSTADPRSYEAVRSLPQARISWGSDLAYALELILRRLLRYTRTPERLIPNLHEQWLNTAKPFKRMSQGSPKLSSAPFYLYLHTLPTPRFDDFGSAGLYYHGFREKRVRKICRRREQCFVFLKTVIHYLHKCDCTNALAILARKSLPKITLWFPGLMKRTRAEMDAYVRRWEESPEGLLEKARSLTIDKMD